MAEGYEDTQRKQQKKQRTEVEEGFGSHVNGSKNCGNGYYVKRKSDSGNVWVPLATAKEETL